jgi:hypothetical protein
MGGREGTEGENEEEEPETVLSCLLEIHFSRHGWAQHT